MIHGLERRSLGFAMWANERKGSGQKALFFWDKLDQIIDIGHPLAKRTATIDWGFLEQRFDAAYSDAPGHPPLLTRLMAGLAILKRCMTFPTKRFALAGSKTSIFSCSAVKSASRAAGYKFRRLRAGLPPLLAAIRVGMAPEIQASDVPTAA